MTRLPANYRDPNPGPCGWDWDRLQPRQKLAIEQAAFERSSAACLVGAADPSTTIPPAVEAAIRSRFKFDSGWSFLAVDELVYGATLMGRQLVGNCVAYSHALLLARRIAHEILAEGQLEEPLGHGMLGVPFIPFSYGVGRDAAGIRGKGDGSTCQGQIEGTLAHGFLPCFVPGLEAYSGNGDAGFPQGTSSANRLFGSSIRECEKWFSYAKKFELVETPRIRTADECWEAIAEKKIPIQICSDWGFAQKTDAKYGSLYVRKGSWAHSMQLVAAIEFKAARFFVVGNQWGEEAHTGNELLGIPGGHMVVTWDTLARWLPDAHAVGLGEINGLRSTLEL